ncbi:hypothetical protein VTI74DRAFT_4932 [Chaetomium olivicolor]
MSDISEESDDIGFLAEGVDSDEHDDGSDGLSSNSTGECGHFFDLQAHDSDGESVDSGDDTVLEFFPQFKRLPVELRHRIWEFFCPDLAVKSRVYWFQMVLHRRHWSSGRQEVSPQIYPGPLLEQQTRAARVMMAVHQESRELALKAFPDTLTLADKGQIRFHAQRDLVHVESTETVFLELDRLPSIRGFSKQVRNLVVEPGVLTDLESRSSALFDGFRNLQNVYYLITTPADHKPQNLRWCTSDKVKHYHFTTWEEQPGLGEDAQHMYCWPDLNKHLAFAEAEIPLKELCEELLHQGFDFRGASFNGKKIWPLVQFLWESDVDRYQELAAWDGEAELEWESASEMEDDGEPNEYESEGIDDSDISDEVGSDTDDLMVVDDGYHSDQDEEGSAQSALTVSEPPHPGTIGLDEDAGEGGARFSISEQSSATLRNSEESEEESDEPALRTMKPKRRRIVGSDSEDDSEDGSEDDLRRRRARTNTRHNPTEISSEDSPNASEQESDEPPPRTPTRKRRRVVDSDSEDSSEDDLPHKRARTDPHHNPIEISSDGDEEDKRRKVRANIRACVVSPEDEDEVDKDEKDSNPGRGEEEAGTDWSGMSSSVEADESEGGAAVPQSLSLAEKLRLHREKVPLPPSDDEDSEIEEMDGDDYDARAYADFQDDDEGNEVSEEGDEDGKNWAILELEDDEDDSGY